MILNDTTLDIRHMMLDLNWNLVDLADAVGVRPQTVGMTVRRAKSPIRPAIVEIVEQLGFDIKLEYIPREVK